MQSAMIFYKQRTPPVGLWHAREVFERLGANVEDTEWRLGSFVVPQLSVTGKANFLIQNSDHESVIEESEWFADIAGDKLTAPLLAKLKESDARFETGDNPVAVISENVGIVSLAGQTSFDPCKLDARAMLQALAREVGGVFYDNVNEAWWAEVLG